jgi:hypothetical protein
VEILLFNVVVSPGYIQGYTGVFANLTSKKVRVLTNVGRKLVKDKVERWKFESVEELDCIEGGSGERLWLRINIREKIRSSRWIGDLQVNEANASRFEVEHFIKFRTKGRCQEDFAMMKLY